MDRREKLRLPARLVCATLGIAMSAVVSGCTGEETERYECYADESIDAGPAFDAAVWTGTGIVDEPDECPAGCFAESTLA